MKKRYECTKTLLKWHKMEKNRVKRGGRVQGGMGDERKLEVACCTYARQKGIIAVKLEKNAHKGIPDYMFVAEGGRVMFVEFKRQRTELPMTEVM